MLGMYGRIWLKLAPELFWMFQFWTPRYKKMKGLEHLPCEQWLKELTLVSSERRRLRGISSTFRSI